MNYNQKLKSLINFAQKLRKNQNILCSDEVFNGADDDYQHRSFSKKPRGLWYAHGNSWIKYLVNEEHPWADKRLFQTNWVYSFKLGDSVLALEHKDIPKFEKKYADKTRDKINWYAVAKEYDGIDIKYTERMSCSLKYNSYWLWGWDVGSGCIWNNKGIKSFKLIKEYKLNWKETV